MSELIRQNDDLKKQYSELNTKLSQARLSESLENQQKGSQFVIVDPANYPLIPSKPNKLAVLMGGAVASLMLSIALALGFDILRQRIWTPSQIETFWGAPVLIEIPEILTDSDIAVLHRKKYLHAVILMSVAVVWGLCLYGMYVRHTFILRQLNPVLQKVIYK